MPSVELDNLTQTVAEIETVADSAIALIGGLAAEIERLKNDPVALQALADRLRAQTGELSAAITANTPTPTPTPTDEDVVTTNADGSTTTVHDNGDGTLTTSTVNADGTSPATNPDGSPNPTTA